MVMVAWMITAGNWFDQTSKLTAVIILGGHHKLVMILALTAFGMLAALAPLTDGFTSANRLEVALIIIAWVISIVALAAALSAILLLAFVAVLLGSGLRLLLRRSRRRAPDGSALNSARSDVLVEMKDVVRVVLPFERSKPVQLAGWIGATHTQLPFVTKNVDINTAGERLHCGTEPASGLNALGVLGRVCPGRSSDKLDKRVAVTEGAVVVRRCSDCAAVALERTVEE